jgi:cyanophycinase
VIGGREDKTGERVILKEVARRAGQGTLVVATVASEEPEEMWPVYHRVFTELGVKRIEHLHVENRDQAEDDAQWPWLRRARVVFFAGGDQLRITARLGGTPLWDRVRAVYAAGGVIAGTSAGASMMGETMIIDGPGEQTHRVRADLHLAPGLGLLPNALIDQHFAERGRIGRLVGAVAYNPRLLGLGIDENTAIVVERGGFHVLGAGAVYVVDGRHTSDTNIEEAEPGRTNYIIGIVLHVLSEGTRFDLASWMPMAA